MLDTFGCQFTRKVRDSSLENIIQVINGTAKAPRLRKMARDVVDYNDETALVALVSVAIDTVLHSMLTGAEHGVDWTIMVPPPRGPANIADLSDGLAGELFGSRGWIARFSKFPARMGEA